MADEVVQLPVIQIGWDDENKRAYTNINWGFFKTHQFVLAVLGTAMRTIENEEKMVLAQNFQRAQAEAAEHAKIAEKVIRNGIK